jgi:phenylalanyl-tRNA synthetase alpha chain
MIFMLSESDTKVLKAIYEGYSDPQSIAEKLGMKIEAVRASADALAEKGFVNVIKSVDELFSLTEEGAEYAKSGLPERRLLQLIGSGKPMSEIKDPAFKIGLGWLRKKGWVVIQAGELKPIGSAAKGKDEEVLEMLLEEPLRTSSFDEKSLSELKNRGLIKSNKSKSWTYELTDAGKSLIKDKRQTYTLKVEPAEYKITFGEATFHREIVNVTPDKIKTGEWIEEKDGLYWQQNDLKLRVKPYDIALSSEKIYPGKKHPYQRLIDKMREIMLEMGFTEIKGEIIQSSFWNFDALFQPQDHPAREMQDTFYLDTKASIPDYSLVKEMHECGGGVGSTGWGGCWSPQVASQEVLRTHTTAVTIKYLADHPQPPVKAFGIDRVYRRESIDATHTPEFEQLEGIIMDRGVTFSHLLGVLKEFYAKMGFEEVRFRPGYFPYTEPSVEPEVFIDGLGWVELGGAGVFRKEVTAPFGIEHPVLAWGLGVSRVAMLKLGLKDLRLLYQSDIQWLRDTPVSIKM